MKVAVFGRTDVGRARPDNEDAFLVADLTDPCALRESVVLERKVGRCGVLLVVADGMGGRAAGEVASGMATDTIYSHLTEPSRKATEPRVFAERLQEALETANGDIHAYALARPQLRGMGTTATAAGLLGDSVYVAHVGDSRAYLVRDRRIRQLTRDQSLTQRLVETGELTAIEAVQSNRRHVILQALGPSTHVSVAMTRQRVQGEDILVLCSDGLSNAVSSSEIADVVSAEAEISAACDRLVDLANERGGRDNITMVLARVAR
ncbi:MAG TPA: Stp1/IreP family PP2C-type Ser/Thr phosphatase [Methylomirabilota bacterium]|nr:Stp1/IreP family PP2C-type Ser/Thr phosphatase [Methylomirabilota bacterium]